MKKGKNARFGAKKNSAENLPSVAAVKNLASNQSQNKNRINKSVWIHEQNAKSYTRRIHV